MPPITIFYWALSRKSPRRAHNYINNKIGSGLSRAEASELVHSLFGCWYPTLVRYAFRATGSLEASEDLVQETFMLLYRALREGQTINNPKGWTVCVVRRQIGKHMRHCKRDESLDVLDTLPAGRVEPEAMESHRDEATKLFSVLTRREEEVILLRMQAMKYREIGACLSISPNSVNTLLARALRKLQLAAQKRSTGDPIANVLEKVISKTLQ
jgi:RNA polymerase sigma-70 factor (ECF subfamily)